MDNEILISSAISLAAIIISAGQVLVAHINKSKEIELAKSDQDRKWKMSMAEFILDHKDVILSTDSKNQAKIKDIIKLAFPVEFSKILFDQIESLVLSELLRPIVMNLNRSREALIRWTRKNEFLEAKIIRESNLAVRDLLLKKAHLLPDYLLDDANKLVSHIDAWLEEFYRVRGDKELSDKTAFVFSTKVPFPKASEDRFIDTYNKLRAEAGLS